MQRAIIIFIKNPERGKVKTRLAATAGDDKALAIYKALLQHTREVALDVEADRYLYYAGAINNKDAWPKAEFVKKIQPAGDLGTRMAKAFKTVFQYNEPVLIIGSDCASLRSRHIELAFQQLKTADLVIGPARDGGYYLLGMNAYTPDVFENINWSTATVFEESIAAIKQIGKSYALLPELSDIDYESDWEQYGWPLE